MPPRPNQLPEVPPDLISFVIDAYVEAGRAEMAQTLDPVQAIGDFCEFFTTYLSAQSISSVGPVGGQLCVVFADGLTVPLTADVRECGNSRPDRALPVLAAREARQRRRDGAYEDPDALSVF